MTPRPGHGLDEYLRMLNELDGKVLRVTVQRDSDPKAQADFDRKVRESLDRHHRRALIASTQVGLR